MRQSNSPSISALERKQAASRSTWVSVLVNFLLCMMQFLTGLWAASAALIADAIHSLSDLVSDTIVLIANKFSDTPPDEEHPYGHYRFENVASLFIGLLLIGIGTSMIWHGANILLEGSSHLPNVHYIALVTAGVVLIAKECLFRYLLAIGKKVESTMLIVNAWHARSDSLSSLIVFIAILAHLAGITWADIAASIIVGAMISKVGIKFTWDAIQELSDQAANKQEIARIKEIISSTPGVMGFHKLRTRKSGDFILVEVDLNFPSEMTVKEAHSIAFKVSQRLRESGKVIEVLTHFDPIDEHV